MNYISEEQLIKDMHLARQCPTQASEVDKGVFDEARKIHKQATGVMPVAIERYRP